MTTVTSAFEGVPGAPPDTCPWAFTVVSHSPLAWSVTVTVSVTCSEDWEPTWTKVVSKVEEKPLQSFPCCVLNVTAASSSPEFCISILYSAASSGVASAELGLAESEISTSAETIVADMLRSIITMSIVTGLFLSIVLRILPAL